MLATERVPHAMLFAGPRGVGKFTLARMFAQAANCERLRDDSCGECATCRSIARLADPAPLIAQGLAERGESADAAMVERMPLILETHPDVWAIVPDPVRLKNPVVRPVLHVGQLRAVQRAAYFKPVARRRVFILDGVETMRWDLANIFLKILEEPPETATLILLTTNPYALLPTIRSRCVQFFFSALQTESVEQILRDRTQIAPAERKLAAQLAEGSPGEAVSLDLAEATELRRVVLRVLASAAEGRSFTDLFAQTAQLAKGQRVPFETVLELFYSLTHRPAGAFRRLQRAEASQSDVRQGIGLSEQAREPGVGSARRARPGRTFRAAAAEYQQAAGSGRGGYVAGLGPLIQKASGSLDGTA